MDKKAAGRLGGLTTSARYDPVENSQAGRDKANSLEPYRLLARIEAMERGQQNVSDAEITRRAVALRREDMTRRAHARWDKEEAR